MVWYGKPYQTIILLPDYQVVTCHGYLVKRYRTTTLQVAAG